MKIKGIACKVEKEEVYRNGEKGEKWIGRSIMYSSLD